MCINFGGKLLCDALACLLLFFSDADCSGGAVHFAPMDKLPSGAMVQVQMNNGQILYGKVIFRSGSTFDLVAKHNFV